MRSPTVTRECGQIQVLEVKNCDMNRDMDRIRDLLLYIEKEPIFDGLHWVVTDTPADFGTPDRPIEEVGYHLNLLIEAGFLKGKPGVLILPQVCKLTWQGHEFLDDIRDPDIWSKIKQRIAGLPSVALNVVAALAEAEIRKKLGL